MIEEIIRSKKKPKEIQSDLLEGVLSEKLSMESLIEFFLSAKDKDKGTCADVFKHISAQKPSLLAPFINQLIQYINYPHPRVKWGVPEALGYLSKDYPDDTAVAILFLIKNTTDDPLNTTVIRWCAAFALTEIAKNNASTQVQLLPFFEKKLQTEENNGVRNVYSKAIKLIQKKKNIS
ncbi:MAG: hypothetical protein PHD83_04235 [Caldisericia bacterium]|nr:hypothetical protein [Caldisericia bacterium]